MDKSEKQQALVVMVKNPVAGKVKTRLAASVGDEKALTVYKALLAHTASVAAATNAVRYIFYSDLIERNDTFSDTDFRKYVQCDGDLGVRMDYAVSIPFKNEFKKVVIIGADCPSLSAAHIQQAFDALDSHDFVIGPSTDGGYYLLGMKKWNRWVFASMPWSSPELLAATQALFESKGVAWKALPELTDIDTLEDLQHSNLSAII